MNSVAFLISVYKSDEYYLERSLDSIINQSYKKMIYIYVIMDGHNKDLEEFLIQKSREIGYKKNRKIKYFIKKNSGLAKSLNFGLSKINEKFIFRQDDDDFSLPERVVDTLKIFKKHPTTAIVGSSIIKYDLRRNKKKSMEIFHYPKSKFNQIFLLLSGKCPAAHPTICFNIHQIEKYDWIDTKNMYPLVKDEDIALWYKFITNKIFIYQIPYPLVIYSILENSLSSIVSVESVIKYIPFIKKLLLKNKIYLLIFPFALIELIKRGTIMEILNIKKKLNL